MAALQSPWLPQFDSAYLHALNAHDADVESHFAGHFGRVLRGRVRVRFPHAHPDDVVQETFSRVLTAVRSRNKIRRPRAFAGFVGAVCNNVALESHRKSDRFLDLDSLTTEPSDDNRDPEDLACLRQVIARVHHVIAMLPVAERNLLSGLFLQEKTRQQICRELGITRATLRVRLHRAKQLFRKRWQASARPQVTMRKSA